MEDETSLVAIPSRTLSFMPATGHLPIEGYSKDARHQDHKTRCRQAGAVNDVSGALDPKGEADNHCGAAAQASGAVHLPGCVLWMIHSQQACWWQQRLAPLHGRN